MEPTTSTTPRKRGKNTTKSSKVPTTKKKSKGKQTKAKSAPKKKQSTATVVEQPQLTEQKLTKKQQQERKSNIDKWGFDPSLVSDLKPAELGFPEDQYDFPIITKRPEVILDDGTRIPLVGQTSIVRPDIGAVLGTFGGHYRVVPHAQTIDGFEAVLAADKVLKDYERTVRMSHNGARAFVTYRFPQLAFKIHRNEIHPQVTLKNCLDRSSRWLAMFEFWRLACLNGLCLPVQVQWSEIHTKGRLTDDYIAEALTGIRDSISHIPQHAAVFQEMGQREVADPMPVMHDLWEQHKLMFPRKYAGNVLQRFEEEKGKSAWHLYNSFNFVINRGFFEGGRINRGRILDLNLLETFSKWLSAN